jgi:protein-export membrane protein SecD
VNARKKIKVKLIAIVILALFSGLVSYPQAVKFYPPVFNVFNKAKINLGLDLQGGIHLEYKADTSGLKSDQVDDSLQGAQDVIERRINAFGVGEPLVQIALSGGEHRIIVELPGVKDIEEAKAKIKETPFLEFKEQVIEENSAGAEGKGGDLGFVKKGMFVPEFDKVLFEGNLKDNEIYPQLVESQFGWHIIKKIEQRGEGDNLEIHSAHILFAKQSAKEESDPNILEMINSTNEQTKVNAEGTLKKVLGGEDFATLANEFSQDPGNKPQQANFVSTNLTGKDLESATVDFANQGMSEPQVSLKFNTEGTKLFAEITKRNLKKPVAIYLDGEIVSAPTVQAEITTGEAVITGSFTIEEAKKLAQNLNQGALPVPLTLVSQQSIEASLGAKSMHKSLIAGMIGLGAVIIFMLFFYRLLGVIASVALIIYSAIMVAIFKLSGVVTPWPVTLTLSGIAGFVLSIGMAVDANILIFERMKEEIRRGRNIQGALDEGFKRAWTSIRDGNISSIITALILIIMGTGFVKGFAVILVIGVAISMFTAINISRTILKVVLGEWIKDKLWLIGIKDKKNLNIIDNG